MQKRYIGEFEGAPDYLLTKNHLLLIYITPFTKILLHDYLFSLSH